MFITEFDIDEVKKEASKYLKCLGIKHRLKKFEFKQHDKKETAGVFKIRLEKLRQKKVKLQHCDQPVSIPAFLVESCNYLRDRIETDGLFRRPGVAMRQKELKHILISGARLTADCEHNAVDVADLLKLFFRELPEPCIPYAFHEVLQRCLDIKEKQKDAILITLLLLPTEYLFTLAYLMEFLQYVAAHKQCNRMDVQNLAIVWTPNLIPFKTGQVNDKQVLEKRLYIIQLLIENSSCIGVVPESLYEHLSSLQPSCSISSHDELESSRHREKKKKRRSGSLTRMLSGIKKMVRRSGSEEHLPVHVTPEQTISVPHTPRIMSTGKKRKASESTLPSFSAKKRMSLREELIQPKRRSRFYTSRSPEREGGHKAGRSMSSSRLRLSHFGLGRKHKKKSMVLDDSGLEMGTNNVLDLTSSSDDYVRISRSEYEDIKSRVSRIESRISSEFENIVGVSMSDLEMTPDRSGLGSIKTVQSAYEKTLESAVKLNSPTSDELARRFSRELKIRGSSEKKIIRSPSARKIGSLRRRSRENNPQVKRNLSLNMPDRLDSRNQFYPGLRRGKPNTVCNGLPDPLLMYTNKPDGELRNFTSQLKSDSFDCQRESFGATFGPDDFDLASFGVLTRSQARRASSFHGCDLSKIPTSIPVSFKHTNSGTAGNSPSWKDAEVFFKEEKAEEKSQNVTGRPSLAKLRSQNAGMVLAKAKLFSTMVDNGNDIPVKAFKSSKPSSSRSREIKKRNSSKSSKERKLQRKDSQNGGRKVKRENSVPKQPTKHSDKPSNNVQDYIITRKENIFPQIPIKTVQSSLKNDINGSSTPGRQSKLLTSPLKEINRFNPNVTVSRGSRIRVTPNPTRQTTIESRTTTIKTAPLTPRRSPRQLLIKSKYINKPL